VRIYRLVALQIIEARAAIHGRIFNSILAIVRDRGFDDAIVSCDASRRHRR
jgi:hypothetical protein